MIQDFSKFKRFFAFGCSFTNYAWPTWANILHQEMDAEFFNLGRRGSGNLFTACRISEANNRFKFCDTDLVIVMFTSEVREDRYIDGEWRGNGNIYNQDFYSSEFVKNYCDVKDFVIKSAAMIDLSMTYLESLPCTSIFLNAFSIDNTEMTLAKHLSELEQVHSEVFAVYQSDKVKPLALLNETFVDTHKQYRGIKLKDRLDGHPQPLFYYHYLKELGFNLTDRSKNYAEEMNKLLLSCDSDVEINEVFKDQNEPSFNSKFYGTF